MLARKIFLLPLTGPIQFFHLPSSIRVTKSKRMRWTERAAGMGDRRGAYRICWGDLMEEDHLEE